MILTPIDPFRLPAVLAVFAGHLAAPDRAIFTRIARAADAERAVGADAAAHHEAALELAARFGIDVVPGAPALDYSWNGRALRAQTEAYVLLHEIAHFQIAPAERRTMVDFGLGAGPETGDRTGADAAMVVCGLAREREEAMASLLGVLWEVELGQPGLASFLDQNWLEGADRPSAAAHFSRILAALRDAGLLGDDDRPIVALARPNGA